MPPLTCCLMVPFTLKGPPTRRFYKRKKLNLNVVASFSRPVTQDPWLETCNPYFDAPNLFIPNIVSFVVSFFYSFPYIVKSKFGNYATLDALAEQWRVQGGTFDPRVLMDGNPSKAKIRRCLMIEKVGNQIDELDKPHLKLVVMHDSMWALIEEQASNRACEHQDRNRDSRRDIQVVDSEVHDISQNVIDRAFWPGQPTVCEYVRDQMLTVNMLWEVAYGVSYEALCLDSLEDFSATEADLMDMKNNILAMWKSRDRRRTSFLKPTFTSSSMGSKDQGSTLGKTFTSTRAATTTGALCGPSYGLGETSLPFFRSLAPPPGIQNPSRLSSHRQDILPTPSYPVMGAPMEYNFDPMMGWPLKPLVPSTYSILSQPLGALFSTPTSLGVTGLSAMLGLIGEESPLVVGSPSHSSWVVAGGKIPTVTVSSATAETTLSASPMTAPRISTACGSVTGGDIHRVIWQCPQSSPNRALAGVGVGRGSARKPMRASASRGQVLAEMLTGKGSGRGQTLAAKLGGTSTGRGQSTPLPPVRRLEERERHMDAHTEASLPLPITMHLDPQGPPVTYSKAASRSPWRAVASSPDLSMYDMRVQMAAHEKEKEAAWATLNRIRKQEWDEQAALKKQKECELRRIRQHDVGCKLAKEGARWQEEYNHERRASRACPNPITDPLGWCEYEWSKKDKYESPTWAGDLWSASPMDHQQLAARMVCSWGLVKAYQQTRQNIYVCPPAPHVMEAYNHKVNHDTHKELGPQEHAVLQYAHTLQYISFCNDKRYKDCLAPAVRDFWAEVVEPFGSRALQLGPLTPLGRCNVPKQGGQDSRLWGVGPYCASLCSLLPRSRKPVSVWKQVTLVGGGVQAHRHLGGSL